MRKKGKVKKENIKLAGVFLVLFFGLLLLSILLKAFLLVKDSRYDSSYPFVIKNVSEGEYRILILKEREGKLFILRLTGFDKGIKDPEKPLGIYPDAYVSGVDLSLGNLYGLPLKYGQLDTNLTILDMARIAYAAKSIGREDIVTLNINLAEKGSKSLLESVFLDTKAAAEDKKVQIVNASGEDGLGGRLASIIAGMGADVILVSTDIQVKEESEVFYSGKKSYTVKRIEKILGIRAIEEESVGFADIVIVVGKKEGERLGN